MPQKTTPQSAFIGKVQPLTWHDNLHGNFARFHYPHYLSRILVGVSACLRYPPHMTVFLGMMCTLLHVSNHDGQCTSPLDMRGWSHLVMMTPLDSNTLHHILLVAMLDLHEGTPCLRYMIDSLPVILYELRGCRNPLGRPRALAFLLYSSSLEGNLYNPADLREVIKRPSENAA